MRDVESLLANLAVAMAKTWDARLPGFSRDFKLQVDLLYVQLPASEVRLRNQLDQISRALES